MHQPYPLYLIKGANKRIFDCIIPLAVLNQKPPCKCIMISMLKIHSIYIGLVKEFMFSFQGHKRPCYFLFNKDDSIHRGKTKQT